MSVQATVIGGPDHSRQVVLAHPGVVYRFPVERVLPQVLPRDQDNMNKYVWGHPDYFQALQDSFRYIDVIPEQLSNGLWVLPWPAAEAEL